VKNRVEEAIERIETNGWVEDLRECSGLKERYSKLTEFLPETRAWRSTPANQLVFYLHRIHGLNFGVCEFYEIDGDRQFCMISGEKSECRCVIPQPFCILRDKNGKPKYPELMPHITSKVAQPV